MTLLDGKKVSDEIISNIKNKIAEKHLNLGLAIIWIGNSEASAIYVRNKIKKCEEVGINAYLHHLDEDVSEEEVLKLIDELNNDLKVNGIILQSPTPKHINENNCFNHIDCKKDIDGFSSESVGNLYLGKPYHISCTPKGIIRLLDYYNIDLDGKNVCLINRSSIVGKPLFPLLINRNATVTMCHSHTRNLKEFTKNSDIIISAVGKPKFITEDMVNEGAIIVDVGISRVANHVVGDVDFDNVAPKCSYISPVPKGVGPMTIAMVLENVLETERENNNG